MALELNAATSLGPDVDIVAYGVFSGGVPADEHSGIDTEFLAKRAYKGSVGETLLVPGDGVQRLVVGLGDEGKLDREVLRRAYGAAARAASSYEHLACMTTGLSRPGLDLADVASSIAEGAGLAAYRFVNFKSSSTPANLEAVTVVGDDDAALSSGIERARAIRDAVVLARDLVNLPPGDLTPTRFAEIATQVATDEGLSITVLDEVQIANERLGGLMGVAKGSDEPPRMLMLAYEPKGEANATVALVGKGITFDSGGLSLKSAEGMMAMKTDMGGAAAVLGALLACSRLGLPLRVRGYMPITENMPGGHAIKPGDVLKIRNGKTIEVLNTDAEGRLVLADALSLASEDPPDAIIDLATLTGACVTALGRSIAGLMGNDDRLIEALRAAGRGAGEALWPLPLPAGYRGHIDSEVADMKNMGLAGQAGALVAALLLEEFVGDIPWAHLDIAGPARTDEDKGYLRKGGTGFGVRTLVELLEHYEPLKGLGSESLGISVLR